MSLILEALRKSEAERRRGEAPGLRVELPPVAVPKRSAVPAWAWIAGAAVVLLATLALPWPPGTGSDVDDRGDGAPTGNETAVAPPATGPAERSDTGTAGEGEGAFPRVERIAPANPVAPSAPDPAPAIPAAPLAAAGPASTEPSIAAAPRPDPRPDADIPRITELASAQRQRLPAMKLSMHMWNEDPARRFVVIDGQRKVDGDRIGEATIAAIDRDGVLLDLDGRRVRVPLP
ncbi:general secretion pathway protein GspB [Luteimonas terricola]|uniref:Type II secretion system protein GspB C-terminal domain-containing protein n=1 Tax=Luteimonas terricola TaxID=645597 RepID=A0ABQ2EGM6_9GAMM|nr:general secretion pathway protein GspB [Luteimonas terricola]GGK10557.1 hypothetical protein GCM10011394_20040 [Luteimonas terricola]